MKLLKRITVIAAMLVLTLSVIGCKKKNQLVGTWENENYTYTFNEDGTGTEKLGTFEIEISNYTVKGDKLSITISFLGTEDTDEFTYSIKKDTLTISDDEGASMTFKRVKE